MNSSSSTEVIKLNGDNNFENMASDPYRLNNDGMFEDEIVAFFDGDGDWFLLEASDPINRVTISLSGEGDLDLTVYDRNQDAPNIPFITQSTNIGTSSEEVTLVTGQDYLIRVHPSNSIAPVGKYTLEVSGLGDPRNKSESELESEPSLTLESNNLLKTSDKSKPLEVKLQQQNGNDVNEVLLVETDENGAIQGILPGQPGYETVFIEQAKVILSSLGGKGFSGLNPTRIVKDLGTAFFQFAATKGGTLDDLRKGGDADILFSIPSANGDGSSAAQITLLDEKSVQIALRIPGSNNPNDIVLSVDIGNMNQPIGADLQGLDTEAELIDFRNQTAPINATFEVYREASFNNTVGIYAIEDEQGGVRDEFGNLLFPGDEGYTQAALRNRIGLEMTGQNNQVLTYRTEMAEGMLFSMFIVADGETEQLLDSDMGNDPAIYFNHLGANTDGIDHIRLLGDNIFGFEDIAGGGDRDFNDVVVKATFTV